MGFISPQFIFLQPTFSAAGIAVGGYPLPMHMLALLPISSDLRKDFCPSNMNNKSL